MLTFAPVQHGQDLLHATVGQKGAMIDRLSSPTGMGQESFPVERREAEDQGSQGCDPQVQTRKTRLAEVKQLA